MRDDTTFQKTFTICQYHLDFLESIDNNASNALRTELDKIIEYREKKTIKETVDASLNFISFGVVLMLLSFVINDLVMRFCCVAIGVFLFGYGAIGGIKNILSKPR